MLRLVWLDADLGYYIWSGYIIDEGRWIENARSLLLFDKLLLPESNVHLLVAPVFQAVNGLIFFLFDISRWSARVFTALCGCAILCLLWISLRQRISWYALVVGLALVAAQEDLVMLSRVCVPEIPAMLFELGVFLTLLNARDRLKYTFLAGVLMVICLGMKATTAPMFLIFGVVAWFSGKRDFASCRQRLLTFWSPALVFGVLAISLMLAINPTIAISKLMSLQALVNDLPRIGSFIGINSTYGMISFPFDNPLAPTVNVWLLGAWIGALVALVAPELMERTVRQWFIAAMIWAIGYALVMQVLLYFPDRYKAHILLPLAILTTLSIHSFLQVGLNNIVQRMNGCSTNRRLVACGLLALPSAVLLAPILLWSLSHLGLEVDRLRWKILAIGAAWMLLTPTLHNRGRVWTAMAIPLPITAFGTWLVGHQLWGWNFWIVTVNDSWLIQWIIILGVAAGLAWLLMRPTALRRSNGQFALATIAVIYIVISIAPYSASFISPNFTLRDVSRDLGALLKDYTYIASHRAEGLFIDNRLRYQNVYNLPWRDEPPQIIVMGPFQKRPKRFLTQPHRLLQTYELFLSSRYKVYNSASIDVYELIQDTRKNEASKY